jgi:hypothetical protein
MYFVSLLAVGFLYFAVTKGAYSRGLVLAMLVQSLKIISPTLTCEERVSIKYFID